MDFSSHSKIFHSLRDVTTAGEGLQILTIARRLRPLSSEGSLVCHTYYDTGHSFILVISVTLTPNAKRLAVGLPLPVLTN